MQNRDAVLAWTTASEKDSDHFAVERSFDGTSFVRIGQVKGQGSKSGPTDYALTDANVAAKAAGPVYYRLQQVDADGTVAYSPVQSVSPLRSVSFAKAVVPATGLYPARPKLARHWTWPAAQWPFTSPLGEHSKQ